MKPSGIGAVLLGSALAISWSLGYADGKVDVGKREFNNSCAVCHGSGGSGNGPLAGIIETKMPDLTTLAAHNGGVFPMARVYNVIDGSTLVKAHGTREMPVWGDRYRMEAAQHYVDVDYDAAAVVRGRILSVAEYVYRLQAK